MWWHIKSKRDSWDFTHSLQSWKLVLCRHLKHGSIFTASVSTATSPSISIINSEQIVVLSIRARKFDKRHVQVLSSYQMIKQQNTGTVRIWAMLRQTRSYQLIMAATMLSHLRTNTPMKTDKRKKSQKPLWNQIDIVNKSCNIFTVVQISVRVKVKNC